MPYVIAVYDVAVTRNARALRFFRRYLRHVQNSVFEGELSPAQLAELRHAADALLCDADSVILYEMRTTAYSTRHVLGAAPAEAGPFV